MPLKRLPNDRDLELRPVKLWLDELEELHEILGEEDAEVRIEADGMRADEIEELVQLPHTRVKSLRLSRHGELGLSDIRVVIMRNIQYVSSDSGSDTLGRAHRAAAVLRRARRPVTGTLPPAVVNGLVGLLLLTGLVTATIGAILSFGEGGLKDLAWLWTALALVSLGFSAWLQRLDRSVVIARRRAESPGFFRRNADQIWLTVLASLLSLAVGFVLGKVA